MKLRFGIAAMAAFALSTSAVAADKDGKGQDQQSQPDAPKEKKICRTDGVTGSRIAKRRICMTQAQWDELAASTKKGLDDAYRNAAGGTNPSFDPRPTG